MQADCCSVGLLMLSLLFAAPLFADSPPAVPHSWQLRAPDGQHVFVMLAPEPYRDRELSGEGEPDVSQEYVVSGLYKAGDTASPLYTVDWYSDAVHLSHDGRYLVLPGPWASKLSDRAVSFYDHGTLLKDYLISDLVPSEAHLKHSVNHFEWKRTWDYNSTSNTLSIWTLGDDYYEFDATTGDMKRRFPGDLLALGALAAIAAAVGWWWWRRRRRKKSLSND